MAPGWPARRARWRGARRPRPRPRARPRRRRARGELRAALAPAQLVERRVARDPEEPRALGAAARIEGALLAERALEGGGGDLLGRRAVAQQRGGVGVDGVRAGCDRAPRRRRRRSRAPGPWPSSACAPHRCYGAERRFVTAAPKPAAGRRYRHGVTPLPATLGAIALLMAVAPAGAAARRAESIVHNKRRGRRSTSATRVGHPDSIGIRGSMPGNGDKAEVMFMRFQVQVFDRRDAHWHNLTGARLGFVAVGSARYRTRQSGTRSRSRRRARAPRPTPARRGDLRVARGRRGRPARA